MEKGNGSCNRNIRNLTQRMEEMEACTDCARKKGLEAEDEGKERTI